MPLPWRKYQVSEASPVGIFPPGTLFTLRSWICSYLKSDSSSTVDTNCSPTNPGDCLITERENFHLPCLLPGGYIHHLQLASPDGLKISYTLGCVDKCNAPCAEGSPTRRDHTITPLFVVKEALLRSCLYVKLWCGVCVQSLFIATRPRLLRSIFI